MRTNDFFAQILQIQAPFSIHRIEYRDDEASKVGKSVHIEVQVDTGSAYRPENSVLKDYEVRTWRHLNMFQYPCYITCRVPKYKSKLTGKTKTMVVPWAAQGSGFTLLFEEFAIELVKLYGCVAEVARQIDIYPQRLWKVVHAYGEQTSLDQIDRSKVRKIGFDETSKKKGHSYITCFIDLETGDLLYIVEGKSSEAVADFATQMKQQNLDTAHVTQVSIDMSPAFIAGAEANFPNAQITFDKFHVSQLLQKAFDSVRKAIGRKEKGGTINKWIFFKPYDSLKAEEQDQLDGLLMKYPDLATAYRIKNEFQRLWQMPDKLEASAWLSFVADVMRSLKKRAATTLANSFDKHHQRIINVIETKITNALLEGFNSKVQTLKRKARGYRDVENLKLMIRLHCSS